MDAPGHKIKISEMIVGTSLADVAVLVISARRGEFETGFERGGQTREHAILAQVSGVSRLVVLVNKMDDPTVGWSKERYDECVNKLQPFLKGIGFRRNLHFMPCSGYTGANLMVGRQENHPWYTGPPFIPYLDQLPDIERDSNGPVRMPIAYKNVDMNNKMVIVGKVESGTLSLNQQLVLQPTGKNHLYIKSPNYFNYNYIKFKLKQA